MNAASVAEVLSRVPRRLRLPTHGCSDKFSSMVLLQPHWRSDEEKVLCKTICLQNHAESVHCSSRWSGRWKGNFSSLCMGSRSEGTTNAGECDTRSNYYGESDRDDSSRVGRCAKGYGPA